jgi:DNA replicative helicase MCM subunit Mcm2 (Cdc46/Mcm family)
MPSMLVRKPIPDYGDIEKAPERKRDYTFEEFYKVIDMILHITRDRWDGASEDEIREMAEESGMSGDKAGSILDEMRTSGRVYERSEGHYRLT